MPVRVGPAHELVPAPLSVAIARPPTTDLRGTTVPDLRPAPDRPPRRGRRTAAVLALAGLAGLAVISCSDGSDASGPEADAATTAPPAADVAAQALADGRTVIDVRTPEEYGAGHVEGAELIDVQAADFDEKVAELGPDGAYVVYCRSGNRSAQAAARMQAEGLDVVDGGALTTMVDAGWPSA